MALEAGTYVNDLVQSNPPSTDLRKQGDDHLRLIKTVLQNTFPGATKAFYLPTTVTKTTTYSAIASDMNKLLLGSTTGGAWTLTLPTLVAADAGWQITVIKVTADINALTIISAAGTIGLDASVKLINNYDSAIVSWSGTTWVLTSLETKQNVIPWVVAGGAVDVITAAYLPSFSELIDGQYCAIRALGANATTTPTFSPNGLTARTITKLGGTALVVGDIINSSHELLLRYNLAGTRWELINPGKAFTGGPLSTLTSMTSKAFNMAKGAVVASAATMDIWTPGDGNTIHGTGTSTITSFGTAPQAGADRWLIADAAFTITNNANIKVQGAATYTASVDDVFHIIADTTTVTYVEIFKANGQAIVVAAAGYTKIIKATTETRTTATLTSDTEFTFSMLANTNYRIKYRYLGTLSSAAGVGADVALVTPTSPTSILHSILIAHGTAILNTQGTTSARLPNNGYGAASVTFIMDGEVILKNGVNAGTFALQTALNTAAGTLTFQLGSSMTYETF